MAYIQTHVCDFNDTNGKLCRTLADAICVLCDKHGCKEHVGKALRVVFEIGEAVLPCPDLPLPSLSAEDIPVPIQPFLDKHADGRVFVEARERAERRVCDSCFAQVGGSFYRAAGGDETIRAALAGFIQTVRAGIAVRKLNHSEALK